MARIGRRLGLVLAATLYLGVCDYTGVVGLAVAASPTVDYCAPNSLALDITLFVGDIGVGVPLPESFGNGTKTTVIFTTIMKANRFFGPERVVWRQTVGPGDFVRVNHLFLSVDETTPLGTDTVIIEVTSSATGMTVLARCTFKVTVTQRSQQQDAEAVIVVPLRPCVLEGAALAHDRNPPFAAIPPGKFAPAETIVRLIGEVNDKIWLKQARIAFRAAASPGIPVIANPLGSAPIPQAYGPRMLGDVYISLFGTQTEAMMVVSVCEMAWQRIDNSQKGIIVVFTRRFIQGGMTLGFVLLPDDELIQSKAHLAQNDSTRLCQHPRKLSFSDLTRTGWTLLLEPDAPMTVSHPHVAMAHELGHTLLLGRGNGLDDDGDGKLPPEPGPRRYDEYCDTKGGDPPMEEKNIKFLGCEGSSSLMQGANQCSNLRPLQIEQARAAAKLVPGAAFGPGADPAGALIADLSDPGAARLPGDVMQAKVEIAETPELSVVEISQTMVGAVPPTVNNRYTTIIDRDNNAATGCNVAELGLPTAFSGAELVTSVQLQAPFPPRPAVWRCENSHFVDISVFVEAKASNARLADLGADSSIAGRITVGIPSDQFGSHSEVIRVQAIAERLGPGRATRKAEGLIVLSPPVLPTCSVLAPVVNPGSVTRVLAGGLPSGEAANVFLGDELVGNGNVDETGAAEIEFSVPNTSPTGMRPVTVQVNETLFLAACEVEIVEQGVIPRRAPTLVQEQPQELR